MNEIKMSNSRKRKFCGHCQEYVGHSTYYRHHDRFFNPITSSWTHSGSPVCSSDSFVSFDNNSEDSSDEHDDALMSGI